MSWGNRACVAVARRLLSYARVEADNGHGCFARQTETAAGLLEALAGESAGGPDDTRGFSVDDVWRLARLARYCADRAMLPGLAQDLWELVLGMKCTCGGTISGEF